MRAVHFKACKVRPHIAHYLDNNERTDDSNEGFQQFFTHTKEIKFLGNYLEGIGI